MSVQHPYHQDHLFVGEVRLYGRSKLAGGVRVVRAIDYHGRLVVDHLEPAGDVGVGDTCVDCPCWNTDLIALQGEDGSDSRGGVGALEWSAKARPETAHIHFVP